jgi:hypothetical protein
MTASRPRIDGLPNPAGLRAVVRPRWAVPRTPPARSAQVRSPGPTGLLRSLWPIWPMPLPGHIKGAVRVCNPNRPFHQPRSQPGRAPPPPVSGLHRRRACKPPRPSVDHHAHETFRLLRVACFRRAQAVTQRWIREQEPHRDPLPGCFPTVAGVVLRGRLRSGVALPTSIRHQPPSLCHRLEDRRTSM